MPHVGFEDRSALMRHTMEMQGGIALHTSNDVTALLASREVAVVLIRRDRFDCMAWMYMHGIVAKRL
jgi:hypothetical protein